MNRINGSQEQAYLESSSFHSKHPDDPFLKYRRPDGSFARWLHTWTFANRTYDGHGLTTARWANPMPWLWDEDPDGGWLCAAAKVGLLARLPLWETCGHLFATEEMPFLSPLYGVLLMRPSPNILDEFLKATRKRVVNELGLIAFCDEHCRLFKKEK